MLQVADEDYFLAGCGYDGLTLTLWTNWIWRYGVGMSLAQRLFMMG